MPDLNTFVLVKPSFHPSYITMTEEIQTPGKWKPTEFITGNTLGNPSTVLQSLKSLQKMEMVHRENNKDGKFYFGIYDVLVRHWIDKRKQKSNQH